MTKDRGGLQAAGKGQEKQPQQDVSLVPCAAIFIDLFVCLIGLYPVRSAALLTASSRHVTLLNAWFRNTTLLLP